MKTFKQYISEQEKKRMIVPAATGIPEELPHGWSVSPIPNEPAKKPKPEPKPNPKNIPSVPAKMTFAARLAQAKKLAGI